jgi:hypothetical protein
MHIDVIEFELRCPVHGSHRTVVPVELPWPKHCVHCFLPVSERRELRRYTIDGPVPGFLGSEVLIG